VKISRTQRFTWKQWEKFLAFARFCADLHLGTGIAKEYFRNPFDSRRD
jgi:hypothetical protein